MYIPYLHFRKNVYLPVPNTNCLIVRCRQNPRVFMVKKRCTDVVQMTKKSKYATPLFVIPHL